MHVRHKVGTPVTDGAHARHPSKTDFLNAYGANSFHNTLRWSPVVTPGVELLGKPTLLKNDSPRDGYDIYAHRIKNDPMSVVFERRGGGRTGQAGFSQPVRWDMLP